MSLTHTHGYCIASLGKNWGSSDPHKGHESNNDPSYPMKEEGTLRQRTRSDQVSVPPLFRFSFAMESMSLIRFN